MWCRDKGCDMALLRLKRHLHVALTSLCTLGVVSGHTLSAGAPPPSRFIPRFIAAPCPFIPAADQTEGSTVDCGSVAVPENRARPNGRWIQLAVAVFRAPESPTRPPLIFLGGGPGSFVLADFGPRVSGSLARDLTAGRDFVMFDQRGVGFSQPALDCQELRDLRYRAIESHPTRAQEDDDEVEAAFACRDRLLASGIELAAYNTAASAADVNDIRRAFGYRQMDVWGLSYGTRLALAVEREFPAGRSQPGARFSAAALGESARRSSGQRRTCVSGSLRWLCRRRGVRLSVSGP